MVVSNIYGLRLIGLVAAAHVLGFDEVPCSLTYWYCFFHIGMEERGGRVWRFRYGGWGVDVGSRMRREVDFVARAGIMHQMQSCSHNRRLHNLDNSKLQVWGNKQEPSRHGGEA